MGLVFRGGNGKFGSTLCKQLLVGRCRRLSVDLWFHLSLLPFLLQQILWKNRFERHNGERCLVTIDGVDFEIFEPTPFDSKWHSHKFGSAGLRCEIAVCIKTGKIVAFNGPFECGRWPDIKIFRSRLKRMLGIGEKVVADKGCRGDPLVVVPAKAKSVEHCLAMNKARARHETINGRLKTWNMLNERFRHDEDKHHIAFRACLVLEQIKIECGHTPFQVEDLDDRFG